MVELLDDLSDVSRYSGDTSVFYSQQSDTYRGANAFEQSVNASESYAITRTDKTIGQTETPIGAWIQEDDGVYGKPGFAFGVQSETGFSGLSGYIITIDSSSGGQQNFTLFRIDNGSITSLAEADPSINANQWYQISVVEWSDGGTIGIRLADAANAELNYIEATDDTYSGGGFGWVVRNQFNIAEDQTHRFDVPTRPDWLSSSTQVVENFNTGTLSSDWVGDANNFEENGEFPYSGPNAAATRGREEEAERGNYLVVNDSVSTSTGETPVSLYVDNNSNAGKYGRTGVGLVWGAQSAVGSSSLSGYVVEWNTILGVAELYRYDSGSRTEIATINPETVSGYGRIVLSEWKSDGTITVDLKNEYDDILGSLSTTDTTYQSGNLGLYFQVGTGSGFGPVYPDAYYDVLTKPVIISAPTNIQVTDASAEDQLTVDGDTSGTNAAGYYIYRAESSGSSKSDYTQVADVTSLPFTDTGLEDGEEYFYRVSSHN